MIITINLKDDSDYVRTVFNKKHNIFKKILDIITSLHNIHKRIFLGILSYVFQKEYVALFD